MTRIGFVGVGAISGIYLENITKRFKDIEIIGVCDLIRERAENAVKKYNIPKLYNDMYELFADPEVDIVLNITRPYEHYEVTKAALNAGKHVYSEKPLGHYALAREDYCHFTSPIRRYTDLAVHQQLWNIDCKQRTRSRQTFDQLAERCTLQEENCDAAYYAASDRMKLRYLEALLEAGDDTVYEAVISRVSHSGLQVDVGDLGVYGFVPAEVIDRHPENARRRQREEYRIGNYIYLRLARIDFVRNSCVFVPAGRLL